MSNRADYIWDALGDQWDSYVQKDQIATLWDGYVEIASDLLLQLYQADLSKSIENIPVFRRYRWLSYRLNKTKAPPEALLPFRFCYEVSNEDILSIPNLLDLVQEPEDDDFLQVTNGSNGFIVNQQKLVDASANINFVTSGVRPGDTITFFSGVNLGDSDKNIRLEIQRVEAADTLVLAVDNLSEHATAVRYQIDRPPTLTLAEDIHFIVGGGTLCFDNISILNASGTGDSWRTVDRQSWQGDFVRDDPRILANGGRGAIPTATNAASVVKGGKTLTDTGATFAASVAVGDYLILRPSGIAPTQVLTNRLVYRVINILGNTRLDIDGYFPLTANQVTYDIVRPSQETFDLVSTENGTSTYPRAFAFQTSGASSPSGTAGAFVAPNLDVLEDTSATFAPSMLGGPVRLLIASGLTSSELDTYSVIEYIDANHVRLDRAVSGPDTSVSYIVGEILSISGIVGAAPGDYEFSSQISNSMVPVDGTVRFVETQLEAAPYIEYYRERAERVAQVLQGAPVVDRLWAPESIVDQEQLFLNFGFPIQVKQENSDEYKNVLQGLWYAYWNGPSIGNIIIGLNLVFDLPFAQKGGVITSVSIPDAAFITGSVQGVGASKTFDVSSANNSHILAFSVDNLPPIYVLFPNDTAYPASNVIADINAAAGQVIASITTNDQIRLSGLTTVKIDTVIGNPGLGFDPGQEDFGTYNVTILGDDGVPDTYEFGSQFATNVDIGQRVVRFEPLTTAVGLFDYISLPEWWSVFGIPQIDTSIPTYSQEDRDTINDLYKNFTFVVRVVADAYTRLGSIDQSIVRFFLEQIKPTISDYMFIVAERFFEIISITDDPTLLGLSPTPSPEYIAQRGGQSDSLHLSVDITTARDLEWNFANFWVRDNPVHPVLGNRNQFETNYHLPIYDDCRLGTEDITLIAPGTITVVDGVAPATYRPAIYTGSVAGQFFTTTGALSLNINGTVYNLPAFSASTLRADLVTAEANAFIGLPVFWHTPGGFLQLRVDDLTTATPSLNILTAHAGFGFSITGVTGQPAVTPGPLLTVGFS